MPELHRICSPAIDALADKAFGALGCEDYGIAIMRGATSWGTHETGILTLPMADGPHDLRIAYDEREAPFVVGPDGQEDTSLAISLADEGDLLACAWARMTSDSPLLGVGVDLASSSDFDDRPFTQRFIKLVFDDTERTIVRGRWSEDLALGYATAFGAKEAAFKATAQPLRSWYRRHDEELAFEVRHFSLTTPHVARGELRDAAAQYALDKMCIARIVVNYAQVEGIALVVATSLSE